MTSAVFVVPVYPPHYHYAYEFVDSYRSHSLNADLLFVFSSDEDKQLFDRDVQSVVMPAFTFIKEDGEDDSDNKAIVHIKKYYGLEQASKLGYKYATTIDCESKFIKSIDAEECMRTFCQKKEVMSSAQVLPDTAQHNISPLDLFTPDEQERLRPLTDGFTTFFWFNNICVYELAIFDRFYKTIDLSKIKSADFDYIIYIYYCLIYEGYSIRILDKEIDLSSYTNKNGGLLELLGLCPEIENGQEIVNLMAPYWIPMLSTYTHENVFITFHHDRHLTYAEILKRWLDNRSK